MKLTKYDPVAGNGAVILWKDGGCTGTSAALFVAKDGQDAGYSAQDLTRNNFNNDQLTSVMVPFGYTLFVWKDNGYQGH